MYVCMYVSTYTIMKAMSPHALRHMMHWYGYILLVPMNH